MSTIHPDGLSMQAIVRDRLQEYSEEEKATMLEMLLLYNWALCTGVQHSPGNLAKYLDPGSLKALFGISSDLAAMSRSQESALAN